MVAVGVLLMVGVNVAFGVAVNVLVNMRVLVLVGAASAIMAPASSKAPQDTDNNTLTLNTITRLLSSAPIPPT